jgi:hypothetical protein
MGVKLAVKKSVVPACGSYGSIAAAIADPYETISNYPDNADCQCDAGEFVAILYTDDGFSTDTYVNFLLENVGDNAAAMTVYSVTGGGATVDTVVHGDGVIEYGDASILIPSSAPFYIVIQNVGGDSCVAFELKLYQAS